MTTFGGSAPGTRVLFRRGGTVVVETVIPGQLLEMDLPSTVSLRRDGATVALVETDDPLFECCGRLLLPWVSADGPGTTVLEVPPPPPFSSADLTAMWQARNRIQESRRPVSSGHADWSKMERRLSEAVDWRALRCAAAAAVTLLGNWPTTPTRIVRWLPPDRTGGVLLIGATERARRNHAFGPGTGGSPTLTARRFAVPDERRLHALTAVATLLGDRLDALMAQEVDTDVREGLAGLFRRVAVRSHPQRPVADPPPSVWPSSMVSAYSAILRALSSLNDVGVGTSSAPLSELWELYEAWVADQLTTGLTRALGLPHSGSVAGTVLGRWDDGDAQVELRYQATVPAVDPTTRQRGLRILGEEYVAAVGALKPDLLLVRRGGTTKSVVVDAKKRSARVTHDDLTENVSKYQWGVRRKGNPGTVPVLEKTILVAPVGDDTTPCAALGEGRGGVIASAPTRPYATLVEDLLNSLR